MGFMDGMMNRWIKKQNPQQKRDMMVKMMPKMMEGMGAEDMMTMMSQMMPKMMESMGSGDMMETMYDMMPKMMENCLTPMNEEERRNMLTFCRKMLGEMEERFLAFTQKGEANS